MGNSFAPWSYGDDHLDHSGIKGMHWYERRFQDKDGKLTPEGIKRYREMHKQRKEQRAEKRVEKMNAKKASSSSWKSKDVRKLSDSELRARNNRLQMESQYKQMTKSKAAKRAEGLKKTANTIFIATAVGVAKGAATQNYKKILGKATTKIAAIKASPTSQVTKKFLKNKSSGLIKKMGKTNLAKSINRAGRKSGMKFLKKIGYPVHELGVKQFIDNSAKIVGKRVAKKTVRANKKAAAKAAVKTVATRFHLRKLS